MPDVYTAGITFLDKAEKTSDVELYVTEAASTAFLADPTAVGAVKGLLDAVADMSLLTEVKRASGVRTTPAALPAIPTDDQAYRSSKITVFFYDNVTFDKYTFTIPGRDPAEYNTTPGTKNLLLTVAAGGTAETEALVVALNTNGRSKNGNAITVYKMQIAGSRQG